MTDRPTMKFVAMISEGQCRESSQTFVGTSHADMISKVATWCRKEWTDTSLPGPPPEDDADAVDLYFADGDLVLVWAEIPNEA
jgi:hypothetical protein